LSTATAVSFDFEALYEALDTRRRDSGMSWQAVARETGVSASTLTAVKTASHLEGDGVLCMLRWLGRSPEAFTRGLDAAADEGPMAIAPGVGPGRYLRFDTKALHAALEAERTSRGMTWRQVAAETGLAPPQLTQLAKGGRTGFPNVMRVVAWLGRRAEDFTRVTDW
jgi:transcriptional regulator with XRE-family HTH domain